MATKIFPHGISTVEYQIKIIVGISLVNMNNINQPLVTVIIPCYNHELFVCEAIQSIIDQCYRNIELIIIDDGSIDASIVRISEKIGSCRERFARFEFRVRGNRGISPTLNEGIAWANGDYLTICASDDSFHQNKVQSQVEFISNNHECQFCYTGFFVYDDFGVVFDDITNESNAVLHSNIGFDDIFTFKRHFPVSGMYGIHLIRDQLGGFDENLSAEDFDVYLRLFSYTQPGYINQKLFYYRYPGAAKNRRKFIMRPDVSESHLKTIRKFRDHPMYPVALIEWNFRRFVYFSAYTETKLYSIKGALKSSRRFYRLSFIGALFRLFFLWK